MSPPKSVSSVLSWPDRLLAWYDRHKRILPWRENPTPYRVWVSEIMLQQTRVEAVKSYYERFMREFPTVETLAAADEEKLMKLWEGLGYYSRARNLKKAARVIAHDGFPDTLAGWLALPGVGDYTAGAVCSIALNLPEPAVDGNVIRVIARLTGENRPKAEIARFLADHYPSGRAGDFTQALMELGATVCLPNGVPRCDECPWRELCIARRDGRIAELPAKTEKKKRAVEKLTVFVLIHNGRIALRRRPAKGVLAGLWELPNLEGHQVTPLWSGAVTALPDRKHIFTHKEWHMKCFRVECETETAEFRWVTPKELEGEYALPTAFKIVLETGVFIRKS